MDAGGAMEVCACTQNCSASRKKRFLLRYYLPSTHLPSPLWQPLLKRTNDIKKKAGNPQTSLFVLPRLKREAFSWSPFTSLPVCMSSFGAAFESRSPSILPATTYYSESSDSCSTHSIQGLCLCSVREAGRSVFSPSNISFTNLFLQKCLVQTTLVRGGGNRTNIEFSREATLRQSTIDPE